MRHFLLILLASVILVSCKSENEKTENTISNQTKKLNKKIDEYFSTLNKLEKFNGVVFASKNDTLIVNKAYNLNQDKNSTTYITTESQFDIHSVSKLMAHYLIEKFEREGKIKKSQSIDTYISNFPDGDKITINMLLNHTSGLPRSFEKTEDDFITLSSEEIIHLAKKQSLIFEPGTDVQYSNVAYEIVYFIIQKISAKSFAQCLNDEVFEPLEMLGSGAHFYHKNKNLNRLAKNHIKKDSMIVQVDNILPSEFKTARIYSTAKDLNKFLNHIKREPFASLLKDKNGVIEKSGGNDGIRVEIYTNLNFNYNFIFLSNYEEVPFQKTLEDFVKIMENKPYQVPQEVNRKSIDLSTDILEKYVGIYSFTDLNNLELTVKIVDGDLVLYQNKDSIATLKAESEKVFFENPKEAESFEFIEDDKGSYNVLMDFKGVILKGIKK